MTRAHVITGSFGAGKTTAIRRLMSEKPPDELWIVILNEFTGAGIDAIAVAEAARGNYDVRLISGGCLCCMGELEFDKQLRDILRAHRPQRLLIEPSGVGHAADIVDVLAGYAAQGALSLDSVVCLIDALDAPRIAATHPENEWSQAQAADVLLLSKPDLASANQRQAFEEIVTAQFPVKRHVGECSYGALPAEALHAYDRPSAFSLLAAHGRTKPEITPFAVQGLQGLEVRVQQLDLWGIEWQLPPQLIFARAIIEPRLRWLHEAYGGWLRRMKAVFKTGPGPSWLVQSKGHELSSEDSAFRRNSRMEIVLAAAPTEPFINAWRQMLLDAANPPRR